MTVKLWEHWGRTLRFLWTLLRVSSDDSEKLRWYFINYHVPGKVVHRFATYEGGPLELDFCPPLSEREDRPCVITLHGGGVHRG